MAKRNKNRKLKNSNERKSQEPKEAKPVPYEYKIEKLKFYSTAITVLGSFIDKIFKFFS